MSKSSEIKDVYAVHGAEEFLRHEAVEAIVASILQAGGMEGGPTHFIGGEVDLATVLDEVRTYSLLGDRRVVIVDEADDFITKHRKALERYCAEPADSGTLILVCKSLPGTWRLHKIIAETGQVIACRELKGQAVNGWIADRARHVYGKQIDARAAAMLREMVGSTLGVLDGELSKLALYVSERPNITAQDIEALVGRHREEDVFGVIDAMASGNTAAALAQWERVLATDRAAPARAIGGLAWGLRRLLDVKTQADRGASLSDLARKAFTHPNVLKQRLARVTVAGLQQQLTELLEADLASKTGLSPVPSAIEKFIVRHSAAASGGGRRHV